MEAAARDVQAKGRLQPWSSKTARLGGSCREELDGFRGLRGLKPGKRQANGRLEGPNKRGLCAGKGQAAMLER